MKAQTSMSSVSIHTCLLFVSWWALFQIFTKESTKCCSTAVVWVKTSLGKRQRTCILSSNVKKYDAVFAALQLEETQNLRTTSLHFALHGNIYARLSGQRHRKRVLHANLEDLSHTEPYWTNFINNNYSKSNLLNDTFKIKKKLLTVYM